MKKSFIIVSFLFSLLMYGFIPEKYSHELNILYLILFVLSTIVFYLYKRKKNYFDFDTLCIITYFFVFFCYPVFIHPFDIGQFYIYYLPFNHGIINKSTLLALVGIESFFIGSMLLEKKTIIIKEISVDKNIFPLFAGILFISISIMKEIIFPSANRYAGEGSADPSKAGGVWGYFGLLSGIIITCAICFQFRYNIISNKKWYKTDIVFWVLFIIYILLSTRHGGRANILRYGLIIISFISLIRGGFKFRTFILVALLGMLFLNLMLIFRSRGSYSFSFNIMNIALDLIINNRNTFLAVDYVNSNGLMFVPFLGALLASIPFLSSLVFNVLKIDSIYTTSAIFLSYLTFGQNMDYGVGTNIIASLYLSLGLFGVIIGMFSLGLIVNYLMNKFYQMSYYGSLAYLILMSYSVYLVRSEYFWFLRYMVWGLLFYCILATSKYFFKIVK
jgi:oligosaccharide repeat unit polymerase